MRNLMMISVMLLASFSLLSCDDPKDIDICLYKQENQTFFCANAFKKSEWQFTAADPRSNKLVCSPPAQYIDFQKNYVCTHK